MNEVNIREGDLYKIAEVAGKAFEIRYGYTCEGERALWEPTPIYPDFIAIPEYTADGFPFATAYQDICEHYSPKPKATGENWCNDCTLFDKQEEYIGICRCPKRQKTDKENEPQIGGATICSRYIVPTTSPSICPNSEEETL